MTLGEKIRLLRNEQKWSQQVLGDKINIAKSVVWKYEKDEAIPSADVIKRIAQTFNVSADYLLFDISEKQNVTKISDKNLLRQFEEIDKFDESEKNHIRYFLDIAINNRKIRQMTA